VNQTNNEKMTELFADSDKLHVITTNNLFGQEHSNYIKNLILDYERKNPVGMDSNVKAWSSDYETHLKTDVFSDYLNLICKFTKSYTNKDMFVSDFWLSHYQKGNYTVLHNHGGYWKTEEASGSIGGGGAAGSVNENTHLASVDGAEKWSYHVDTYYAGPAISGCYYPHVEEGASPIIFEGLEPIYPVSDTLIIFSPEMNHEVPPTDTERIVMSFNLFDDSKR
tara:strand:+ start:294 stop:962 length:669 start_codon:yes stop_codon:yes gene_type:complete